MKITWSPRRQLFLSITGLIVGMSLILIGLFSLSSNLSSSNAFSSSISPIVDHQNFNQDQILQGGSQKDIKNTQSTSMKKTASKKKTKKKVSNNRS